MLRSGWSSGMIPPLGGGGPGFNPRTRPEESVYKHIHYILVWHEYSYNYTHQ